MLRMAFRLGPGSFHPEARVCLSWVCRPVGALGRRGQEAGDTGPSFPQSANVYGNDPAG